LTTEYVRDARRKEKLILLRHSELENRTIEVSDAALCGAFSESAASPKSRTPAALTTYDHQTTPKAKTAPHRPITRFSHLHRKAKGAWIGGTDQ
jgi:hypothetical protein